MFIIYVLHHQSRLRPGLLHVKTTCQAYQRDSRHNTSIIFPLELEHNEIGIAIDENSENYTVGENVLLPLSISIAVTTQVLALNISLQDW